MLQLSVRTGIHQEQFGKFCLGHAGLLPRCGKALGKVVSQAAFAWVFHGFDLLSLICAKHRVSVQKKRGTHHKTVVLLSKLNAKRHIEVELNLDELDLTAAESKATYDEIKAYVLEKHSLKVSSLYISQVKRKCGLDVGQNYNLSKKEDAKVPQCPPEKEAAIIEALKHFQMI